LRAICNCYNNASKLFYGRFCHEERFTIKFDFCVSGYMLGMSLLDESRTHHVSFLISKTHTQAESKPPHPGGVLKHVAPNP
jgi:hypothetical protein